MSTQQELIAAALTAADELDFIHKHAPIEHTSDELREACARAIVQPAAPDMAERDALIADNERLMQIAAQEVSAASQPVGDSTSSFPDRDLTKPAGQQGLFHKFDVRRVDGSSLPGCKHHGCEYFVLDLNHDDHASAALRAYALSCSASHPQLAADLLARYPTVGAAEVPMPEHVEQLAITRYRPVPNGMFGYKVVAGDGTRSVFEGTKSECTLIARKLTEAFLDGAHVAGDAREAAGYAAGLAAVGWRDVADELPKEAQEVLFVRGGKTIHGAWIGGIFWHNNQKMAAAKWMPLPAPQSTQPCTGR